jgi:hypothetical protein
MPLMIDAIPLLQYLQIMDVTKQACSDSLDVMAMTEGKAFDEAFAVNEMAISKHGEALRGLAEHVKLLIEQADVPES